MQESGGKGGWVGVGISVLLALAALSHTSDRPAIIDFANAKTNAQSAQHILYRGLSNADLEEYHSSGVVRSKGARTIGILAARSDLLSKSLDVIGQSHAWGNDFSPVLSLTSDPNFAAVAATHGTDSSGMVAIIRTDRAIPNPMGFKSESEWLLPLETLPGEIVDIVPASALKTGMLDDGN